MKQPDPTARFPPAPRGVTPRMRRAWDAIVRSYPADHWRAADLPLLLEMLRANETAETLAKRIAATTDTDQLAKLLKLRDTEARRAATLATKLRLAPQSRADRHLAERLVRDARGGRPWEVDPAEEFFQHGNYFT